MTQPFINARIFLGGVELTGQFNQVSMSLEAESLDNTVFGSATRTKRGGLKHSTAQGAGFYESSADAVTVDPTLFDNLGSNGTVITVFPEDVTLGSTSTGAGYAFQTVQTKLSYGGQVGAIYPFTFEAEGRGVKA